MRALLGYLVEVGCVFVDEIPKYSNIYRGYMQRDDIRLIIKFYNLTNSRFEYCVSFFLTEIGTGHCDLYLDNVYIPVEIRGKGYVTGCLTKIRDLPFMSGRCQVMVPMDVEGWKTIIDRAGFRWIPF